MAFIINPEHGILHRYFPEAGETEVTVPEHVRMIDKYAFAGCTNLYAVRIPEGVVNIGAWAFKDCKNLLFVKFPESLARMGLEIFSGCEMLGEIKIPEHVAVIQDSAFMNCKNLRSAVLPKNLEKIGDRAFKGCTSLKKISIPEQVRILGVYCFSGCEKLTSVVIPKKLEKIQEKVFAGCHELRFVMIPENIKNIRNEAFPTGTVLHFCIQGHMFSINADKLYLANAFCQPEIPEHTEDIIKYFIMLNDAGSLKNFLECGFIKDKRIDDFIKFAIENQKYETQITLMDYKHKHIGYQPKNWEL